MPDDARARVEAWMNEICREIGHGPALNYRNGCPDCLLGFAAAQYEAGLLAGKADRDHD